MPDVSCPTLLMWVLDNVTLDTDKEIDSSLVRYHQDRPDAINVKVCPLFLAGLPRKKKQLELTLLTHLTV